jgi:HK97 family phage major capsid protein
MNLLEMKKEHAFALNKAENALSAAEKAGRPMTENEEREYQMARTAADALAPKIKQIQDKNTMRAQFGPQVITEATGRPFTTAKGEVHFSSAYADDFHDYIASGGTRMGAALYEGSSPAGGYAVPITVDSQIVPLAPQEMGVRTIANVVPTIMDMKIPRSGSFGTAAAKAETSAFTESEPTLDQFLLSAFMAGIQHNISWELAQDVPAFQQFAVSDMLLAQQMYEENLFVNGTGTGQAQGLIGNVGAGVTEEPDDNGNLVSIDGTLDLIGKLNSVYHANAGWLMSRATSIIIRKAQRQANLFEPVWTRENGKDYLHGYPVTFSTSMPTAARSACPLLFGDFKQGYVIGDRGGSGINIKVLDQPLATSGIIILLAYRRTDGRVRRSEAIQSYNIAAS